MLAIMGGGGARCFRRLTSSLLTFKRTCSVVFVRLCFAIDEEQQLQYPPLCLDPLPHDADLHSIGDEAESPPTLRATLSRGDRSKAFI